MKYIWKWWVNWESFGDKFRLTLYFSSRKKMERYQEDHFNSNKGCDSYKVNYKRLVVK